MIKYSREFGSKSFSATEMKKAYLKAVKWYATNIISNENFKNVQTQFVKEMDENNCPKVTIHLFAVINNEEEVMSKHCEACREMHNSFFMNEDTQCSRCSALGFQKRLKRGLDIKKSYYKDILNKGE